MPTRVNFRAISRALPVALALLASPCAQAGGGIISPNFRDEDEMHFSFADTGLLAFRAGPGLFNSLSPNWSSPSGSFVAPRYSPSFVSFDRSGDGANGERFAMTPLTGAAPNAPDEILAQKTFSSTATSWTTADNWTPSGVPGASDDVLINAGTSTMTLTGSDLTIQYITYTNTSSRILQNSSAGVTPSNLTLGAVDGSGNLINVDPASASPTFTIRNGTTANLNLILGASGNFNVGLAAATLSIASAISETGGARSITKTGAGTAIFSGANTYTGGTTISAGTLQLGNGGTTGTLSTSSAITDNANFTINRSNAVTQGTDFSGSAISGTGTLTQAGSGTTTLNAANTYQGGTSVTAGTLLVINPTGSGTGTTSITVTNAGTTLSGGTTTGAGGISGAVNINPSATLAPGTSGNGAGTTAILNTGALTLVSASNFSLDLNGTTAGTGHDKVISSGPIVLTGSNILLTASNSLNLLDKFFVLSNSGATINTGTFAQNLTVTANNGYVFAIDYFDSDPADASLGNDISLTLTAVPEPRTWIGGALALLAVGWTQRKRFGKRLRVVG